ncbi:MAG: hypothetical protein M1821_005756 [Bathelium mastoideum]|nr:MAG: hypothetical protein M1821_005756 [Bathelium mastoideum]
MAESDSDTADIHHEVERVTLADGADAGRDANAETTSGTEEEDLESDSSMESTDAEISSEDETEEEDLEGDSSMYSTDDEISSEDGMPEAAALDFSESKKVINWYKKVPSRRVDLVGDYAGSEMFLIEGDSILLRCFTDAHLDMQPGFQILHATFIVESFLQGLLQRNCNFKVAFFHDHKLLAIPEASTHFQREKFLLARTSIIRHLRINFDKDSANSIVHEFPSLESPMFKEFLQQHGMYFVMCHDGAKRASPREIPSAGLANATQKRIPRKAVVARVIVAHFMREGYNVVLINGLVWQDTKVMTMVLESSSRGIPQFDLTIPQLINDRIEHDLSKIIGEVMPSLQEHLHGRQPLTERELLTIMTIRVLMKSPNSEDADFVEEVVLMLRHTVLLRYLPLQNRSVGLIEVGDSMEDFLHEFVVVARQFLESVGWDDALKEAQLSCDVADLLDGRLLRACYGGAVEDFLEFQPDGAPAAMLKFLLQLVGLEAAPSIKPMRKRTSRKRDSRGNTDSPPSVGPILPFSNRVFDNHLKSIRLPVDKFAANNPSAGSGKIFKEITHWHNSKKLHVRPRPSNSPSDKRREGWERKRNQMFLTDMHKYAESLNNAIGIGLEPELVGTVKSVQESHAEAPEGIQGKHPKKGISGGKKTQQKNSKKTEMYKTIAAKQAKQEDENAEKTMDAWRKKCRAINDEKDPSTRYVLAEDYLKGLNASKRKVLWAEIEIFMINALLTLWIECCRNNKKDAGSGVAALIFDRIRYLAQHSEAINKIITSKVNETVKALGLPIRRLQGTVNGRELPFEFVLPLGKSDDLSIPLPSPEFQLTHCGPYMDRNVGALPDKRVSRFDPDEWQRKVLDAIDANSSLLVIAPTSSGKTFISFYAMKQILQEDDDGVLVYVAPTKALVNQIAAEIQARFKKDFPHAGKSVWAIHTRDYRINNPSKCQILVTVPHVLQIMLLAPINAKTWSKRVRRIIFDEVHAIGQADDGLVWEQLLLLAPCPIIALSATIGNPKAFNDWLQATQQAMNHKMVMISHNYRYSDLRKFIYRAPKKFEFQGLRDNAAAFSRLGLDEAPEFAFLHPAASLINKSRGLPDDLHLEPRDCLLLWQAMKRHQFHNGRRWIGDELHPSEALPEIIRKIDVIEWGKKLTEVLQLWMTESDSPFDVVFGEISEPIMTDDAGKPQKLSETTLPLLNSLHEQDALPALLFNYNRYGCEMIAKAVLIQLQHAEAEYKESNKNWQRKVKEKEQQEKAKAKAAKAPPQKKSKDRKRRGSDGDDDFEDESTSRSQLERDAATGDLDSLLSFDPNAPIEKFSFANNKKLSREELDGYFKGLRKRGVGDWLLEALERGIGVHHAGMNRAYRQVVEMLFRRGFLRVVIATGTLALGINAPAKTTVFAGDSVFLTALNFRQASGRSGRRGFDVLGNVVFQGIPTDRVLRLVSSSLPDLNGHFPITTTLVLRLFTLLHESNESEYAVKAIDSLLSQPRLYLGSHERKTEVLHHLRFSIEYLRRQHLLDAQGVPLNFAGCVSHLYFVENSSFAFHALLKEGYFHKLCRSLSRNSPKTLNTLMLVMSHVFGRRECRQADMEFVEELKKSSSSVVLLPKLPSAASNILKEHNQETLGVYMDYVKTFIDAHVRDPETTLPLSGLTVGGEDCSVEIDAHVRLPPAETRSAFVALSGHGDYFESISELCQTTRQGVFLEEAVVPHIDVYPDETEAPLNAYLYDFFRNGDINSLERANGIRKGDVWFLLNDFSLVLATIVTSLQNFLKLTNKSEIDMLDMKGIADLKDDEMDDIVIAAVQNDTNQDDNASAWGSSKMPAKTSASPVSVTGVKKGKAKQVAESWDADSSDEETTTTHFTEPSTPNTSVPDLEPPAWEEADGNNNGLLLVLRSFQMLKKEFDNKFRRMWA